MGRMYLYHVKSAVFAELCPGPVGIHNLKDEFFRHLEYFSCRRHLMAWPVSGLAAALIAANAHQSTVFSSMRELNVGVGSRVVNCSGRFRHPLFYAERIQLKLFVM